MLRSKKSRLVAVVAAAAMSLSVAAPASAQNTGQAGLVNVAVVDAVDVNNVQVVANVQVPIGIAANVCGVEVNANVLAAQRKAGNDVECDAVAESEGELDNITRQLGRFPSVTTL